MPQTTQLQEILDSSHIDPAVFELRPDYRAMLPWMGFFPEPAMRPATPFCRELKRPPGRP
jgi:hypothetical protein